MYEVQSAQEASSWTGCQPRGFVLVQLRFLLPIIENQNSTVAARVESGEERKETQDRVDEERRYQTDVRIYAFHDAVSIFGCD